MTEKHNDIEMIQERDVPVRMRDGVQLVGRRLSSDRRGKVSGRSLRRRFTTRISRGRTFPKSCPHSPRTLRFGLVP